MLGHGALGVLPIGGIERAKTADPVQAEALRSASGAFSSAFQADAFQTEATGPTVALKASTLISLKSGAPVQGVAIEVPSSQIRSTANPPEVEAGRTVRVTVIGRSVLNNQTALQLSALALLNSLDAKLAQLRDARSNSEDPATYEDLKRRVEDFLAGCSAAEEAPAVKSTLSLADGLKNWWANDHISICNKALNLGLFSGGLAICSLAGALGTPSVVTIGTLIAGKDIPDALAACVKLLKGD